MAITNYLTKDDYKPMMRTYRLDQVLESQDEDEEAILDAAEIDALGQISFFLANYYNLETEFNKTAGARNAIIVRWAKVLVIYYIYERIPDESVPERVVKNYDDVLKMLEEVNGAEKNVPGLDPKTVTDDEGNSSPVTVRRWGSRPRRSNDATSNTYNRH